MFGGDLYPGKSKPLEKTYHIIILGERSNCTRWAKYSLPTTRGLGGIRGFDETREQISEDMCKTGIPDEKGSRSMIVLTDSSFLQTHWLVWIEPMLAVHNNMS